MVTKTITKQRTPKQQRLLELLFENYGHKNTGRTLQDIMLEAGYSRATAENPHIILKSPTMQAGMKDYVGLLDDKRKQALRYLTDKKLQKASGRDLAYINDILTKNHQLLSGGSTENVLQITWQKDSPKPDYDTKDIEKDSKGV